MVVFIYFRDYEQGDVVGQKSNCLCMPAADNNKTSVTLNQTYTILIS